MIIKTILFNFSHTLYIDVFLYDHVFAFVSVFVF